MKIITTKNAHAECLIHETGHVLGLIDYYDSDDNNGGLNGGLGRFSLMDANQGDLDPFSKAILGWVSPTLVYEQNYEVTLEPFTTTGDCLFISKLDNGTYFDEFYVISSYTPDGLNEYKHDMEYGLYSISGVLIYHVNFRTKKDITNVTNIEKYISLFK